MAEDTELFGGPRWNYTGAEAEVLDAFYTYLAAYSRGDLTALLNGFCDDLTGFGSGSDEVSLTCEQSTSVYRRDLEQLPTVRQYVLRMVRPQILNEGAGLVMAEFDLSAELGETTVTFEHLRTTQVFRKENGVWKQAHGHISMPFVLQDEGESVPLRVVAERGLVLERRIASRTAELEEANTALAELAAMDPLTGLWNRREFFRLAELEVHRGRRTCRPFCLIMLDVDEFTRVNNVFGHQAGDRLLCEVAQSCKSVLRVTDIIGRYGGDEFAILLPDTGPDDGMVLAERLLAANSRVDYRSPDGRKLEISFSLGLSYQLDRSDALDEVVARADQALYRAKANGRDRAERDRTPQPDCSR